MNGNEFTFYAILLLCIGSIFLIIAYKDGYFSASTLTLRTNHKLAWVDLGLFLWLVVMVLLISPYGVEWVIEVIPYVKEIKYHKEILSAFISQFNLLCFLFFSYRYHKNFWKFSLNEKHYRVSSLIGNGFSCFLMSLPLIFLTNVVWRLVMLIYADWGLILPLSSQHMVEVFREMDSTGIRVLGAFTAIIMAPITEECIFRGAIYRFLKTKVSPLTAATLSSVLFAGIHCNLAAFLPLFLLGLLLVKAYEFKGHIAVPIIFHSLFNLNTILLIYCHEPLY